MVQGCYTGPTGTAGVGICRAGMQVCATVASGGTDWGACTGEVFPAAVIESGQAHGTVTLDTPAVRGRCDTRNLPLGADIHVRCTKADVTERQVRFERVS